MYHKTTISLFALFLAFLAPLAAHAAYSITQSDVEAEVAAALETLGVGEAITVSMKGPSQSTLFKHHGTVSLNLENVDYDARRLTWDAEAQILSHGNILRRLAVSGSYEMMIQAPVLTRNLRHGQIITKRDIIIESFPSKHITQNTALNADELIGLAPRRNLTAGRPISRDQVEAPLLIKRGAAIQMYYTTPYMEIKAMGEALENGAKGQTIRARNSESGLTVRGVVESSNEIRISGGSSW